MNLQKKLYLTFLQFQYQLRIRKPPRPCVPLPSGFPSLSTEGELRNPDFCYPPTDKAGSS